VALACRARKLGLCSTGVDGVTSSSSARHQVQLDVVQCRGASRAKAVAPFSHMAMHGLAWSEFIAAAGRHLTHRREECRSAPSAGHAVMHKMNTCTYINIRAFRASERTLDSGTGR
jgi:hypothetical protein